MEHQEEWEKQVHEILQEEIAGRVWYQDKGCEETLRRGLQSAESRLAIYAQSLRQKSLEEGREGALREVLESISAPEMRSELDNSKATRAYSLGANSQTELFIAYLKDLLAKLRKEI